jgi:hypothetical protein
MAHVPPTKTEALAWARRITSGSGVGRDRYLDRLPRGKVAAYLWNEPVFTLGIEYGVLIALIELFDLNLRGGDG